MEPYFGQTYRFRLIYVWNVFRRLAKGGEERSSQGFRSQDWNNRDFMKKKIYFLWTAVSSSLIASPFPNKINWNIDVKANKTIQNVLFLKNFTKLRYEGVFFINSLLANKYSVQKKHFFYFCLRGKKIAYLMNRNYVYDKTQSKAKT